jgi:hypothetical protein
MLKSQMKGTNSLHKTSFGTIKKEIKDRRNLSQNIFQISHFKDR